MSRVKYSANYNPIIEYWEKIRSGEIKVSKKVYETYKKLVFDVNNPGEFFIQRQEQTTFWNLRRTIADIAKESSAVKE